MPRKRRSSYTGGLSFYEDKEPGPIEKLKKVMGWVINTLIAIFLAAALVMSFGFRTKAYDDGMTGTVEESQSVLVDRLIYRFSSPERGAVVAFYPGGDKSLRPLIRRVVAVPGDTIEVVDGTLLVNGTPEQTNVSGQSLTYTGIADQQITLNNDEYFVLSDNRDNTEDSRNASIGLIQESYLIGKVWLALPGSGSGLHTVK